MQVLVLLAGVLDPKGRLASLDAHGLSPRLSPFDEAALECGLKLRDAGAELTAMLVGDASLDPLLRTVMAHRPQRALRLDVALPWDARAATALLAQAVRDVAPDLVLTGREFGDCDDGVLPPALAEALGVPFCGQAHAVVLEEGRAVLHRSRAPREEVVRLPLPALASITNDRGNRLRHPLMKNVVLARRAPLEVMAAPEAAPGAVTLRHHAPVPPPTRGEGACRLLAGSVAEQAAALAALLREAAR